MKTWGQHCNWLGGTKFEAILQAEFKHVSEAQWRKFVFDYCKAYQSTYSFDLLEEAFTYLELQEDAEADELLTELPNIKHTVEVGMGEYCFSLNEISEAIYRLLDNKQLTYACVVTAINHVLEAYSCNEPPEIFLESEDQNLCNLFQTIITMPSM
jgi:hypothetical protein